MREARSDGLRSESGRSSGGRWLVGCATWGLALALAGCGAKKASDGDVRGASSSSTGGSGSVAVSRYDSGPRASESPAVEAQAKAGEQLFKDKGCSACHGFGRRISCPDLKGVSMRRTAQWMEHQILEPEAMIKQDPIARQLFAQFSLQMPNQRLTPEEARAVVEFLKHQDHEASASHE